jgi:hypothetical protein
LLQRIAANPGEDIEKLLVYYNQLCTIPVLKRLFEIEVGHSEDGRNVEIQQGNKLIVIPLFSAGKRFVIIEKSPVDFIQYNFPGVKTVNDFLVYTYNCGMRFEARVEDEVKELDEALIDVYIFLIKTKLVAINEGIEEAVRYIAELKSERPEKRDELESAERAYLSSLDSFRVIVKKLDGLE